MPNPDPSATASYVDRFWDAAIVPTLVDYITIPNVSPVFDADWEAHGYMEQALQLALEWLGKHLPDGVSVEVGREPGRTPVVLVDFPGELDGTVLLYGHLDKQPEMEGWREDLGPWSPKLEDGKLYGRGGADDGYALFASVAALAALAEQGVARSRCVVLVEFSEESGSPDLPYWVQRYAELIGAPELVVCLDSGAGNYEQLWSTTSLRGVAMGTARVDVLTEGVHSGMASGIVPDSLRLLRQLLDRVEDPRTGELPPALSVPIPEHRRRQAERVATELGEGVWRSLPWAPGAAPVHPDPVQAILDRTWRPTLTVTGADGLPPTARAGNVLRPQTTLKLSVRLPPTADAQACCRALEAALTDGPPIGGAVTVAFDDFADGWHAPALAPWLEEALDAASLAHYGKPALHVGEGGSIPFMGMLHAQFPDAQFVITGVLGPNSNAHGPNEFLHVPYAKKLTACAADLLAAHGRTR